MANSLEDTFNNLPKITRAYLVTAFGTTLAVTLGFLDPYKLLFVWDNVWRDFHLWRVFTCFIFLGNFSFPFLMSLFFLVRYSGMLEATPFEAGGSSTTADYAYCLLCGAVVLLGMGFLMGLPLLGQSMIFYILYVWSRKYESQPVSFFGFQFVGLYMPWVMVAFALLIGNSIVEQMIGIVCGHVFYFLMEVLPRTHGTDLLRPMPKFLDDIFSSGQFTTTQAQNGGPVRGARPQGHNWGAGRALGAQ